MKNVSKQILMIVLLIILSNLTMAGEYLKENISDPVMLDYIFSVNEKLISEYAIGTGKTELIKLLKSGENIAFIVKDGIVVVNNDLKEILKIEDGELNNIFNEELKLNSIQNNRAWEKVVSYLAKKVLEKIVVDGIVYIIEKTIYEPIVEWIWSGDGEPTGPPPSGGYTWHDLNPVVQSIIPFIN